MSSQQVTQAAELLIALGRTRNSDGKIQSPSWKKLQDAGLLPDGMNADRAAKVWYQMKKAYPIEADHDPAAKGAKTWDKLKPDELTLLKGLAFDVAGPGSKPSWKLCAEMKLLPKGMDADRAAKV